MSIPPRIYINWACDIINPLDLYRLSSFSSPQHENMISDLFSSKHKAMKMLALDSSFVWLLILFHPQLLNDMDLTEIILYPCSGGCREYDFTDPEKVKLVS